MITVIDYARQYFPKADAALLDFILWERTAFPVCDVRLLTHQLRKFRRAMRFRVDVCGMCGKFTTSQRSPGLCPRCNKKMDELHALHILTRKSLDGGDE